MIQRDNGSPGTTKEVRYVIMGHTQKDRFKDLMELSQSMIEPPYKYILISYRKKKGSNTEYYATFVSQYSGLKD